MLEPPLLLGMVWSMASLRWTGRALFCKAFANPRCPAND